MKFPGKIAAFSLTIGLSASVCAVFEDAEAKSLLKLGSEKQEPNPIVVIETCKGPIKLLVYRNEMPATAENFLELVQKRTYEGTTFHRYEPKFCVQGGDPTGTGRGGSGKTIPLEINKQVRHSEAGMVGMARGKDRNSASSQFYIILSPQSGLDNDYAVFARVVEGLETVFAIRKGDTMDSVYLEGSKKEAKKETKKDLKKESQ